MERDDGGRMDLVVRGGEASLERAVASAHGRRTRRWAVLAGLLLIPFVGGSARAFYLDDGRNFELRARLYTEAAVAADTSEPQTHPARAPFQLISHRTFFNPEFDARLTRWQPFSFDDVSFRLALWGFYDGIYDYGTSQYDRSRNSIQGRLSQGHTLTAPVTRTDQLIDLRKMYTYQPDPVLGSYGDPGDVSDFPFRLNEMYLNF